MAGKFVKEDDGGFFSFLTGPKPKAVDDGKFYLDVDACCLDSKSMDTM